MTSYAFKEWLTFDEAAAWLTDKTGSPYDEQAISRAALNGRLSVHYWPTDDVEIGLYRLALLPNSGDVVESPLHLDNERCEVVCLIDGPIPIRHYQLFQSAAQTVISNRPVGLSARPNEDELYGCYRIGDEDRPTSVTQGNYKVLVHLSDMEQLQKNLPMPAPMLSHDLVFGECFLPAAGQRFYLASSSVSWSRYPDAEQLQPVATAAPESLSEPLLRALGLAAHLIAELGGKLDEHEQLVSHRRRYMRGSSPNITAISKALATTAVKLRHEGHNYQGAGFEKLLRQALRSVE